MKIFKVRKGLRGILSAIVLSCGISVGYATSVESFNPYTPNYSDFIESAGQNPIYSNTNFFGNDALWYYTYDSMPTWDFGGNYGTVRVRFTHYYNHPHTSVPVPVAATLFGSALAGLILFRHKKKRAF